MTDKATVEKASGAVGPDKKLGATGRGRDGDDVAYNTYKVGPVPYYRDGEMFQPGELVRIPADELPSVTWLDPETDEPVVVPRAPEVGNLTADEKAIVQKLREDKAAQLSALGPATVPPQSAKVPVDTKANDVKPFARDAKRTSDKDAL